MTEPILLLGGGGHARVVADSLLLGGRTLVGVADPGLEAGGRWLHGIEVLGDDDGALAAWPPATVELANGLGFLPGSSRRQRLYEGLSRQGYIFCQAIHPTAVIAGDAVLGEGVQVMAGAVINSGARIEDNVIINTRSVIEHDCRIGAHTHVAPGAVICGDCELGEACFVGAGAVVIQGRRVARRTVVPAGHCWRRPES